MTIPLATTTISVLRSDQDGSKDSTDTLTFAAIAMGVRAVIGNPRGTETNTGGSSEAVTARLDCDPTDLAHGDRVTDETLAQTWEVTWVRRRIGFGLDHIVAELLAVTDRAEF